MDGVREVAAVTDRLRGFKSSLFGPHLKDGIRTERSAPMHSTSLTKANVWPAEK